MAEENVVTAVGVFVSSILHGSIVERFEKAMSDAVLECAAEGITTEEKNSWIIRERMMAAHQRVQDEIAAEQEAAAKEGRE